MKPNQVPFRPALEGFFAARFYRTIREVVDAATGNINDTFSSVVENELGWLETQDDKVNPVQQAKYKACWLLLRDLIRIGWKLSWSKNCPLLAKPVASSAPSSPSDIAAQKESVRQAMSYARSQKIRTYRSFIERLIFPRAGGLARKPITDLIGDGSEIANDLLKARRSRSQEKRDQIIRDSVRPYLQLVNEKDRCEFTGQKLSDIWRFFRFTWTNPPESTPGRTLLFLIRDAARENHPVMGIFSLENAALRIRSRDETLGWDPTSFAETIAKCQSSADLRKEIDFLVTSIDRGINEVYSNDLCASKVLRKPTDEDVKTLAELARKADQDRMAALKAGEAKTGNDKHNLSKLGNISIDAENALYKRKRAESLSRLLGAKRTIQQLLVEYPIDIVAENLLGSGAGVSAVRVALFANKNRHVGTSILELNVCGAVPPYNHILGGKLAALLAISPKVVADYRERYGNRASDIASLMKREEVVRPAELVFVGTTSLYGSGASQYNRLKIPKSIFGSKDDIVWRPIGITEGYGTLHIAPDTLVALEDVIKALGQSLRANHIFGEGASPKFRSLRMGIEAILEPKLRCTSDQIGKHEMKRLVFGAKLVSNCDAVLSSANVTPLYYFRKTRNADAGTQRIVDYWMSRWLSSRIEHLPALKAMQAFDATTWLEKSFESIGLDVKSSDEVLQEA